MPHPNNDDLARALEQMAQGTADEPAEPSDDPTHAAATPATPRPRPVTQHPVPADFSRPRQPPGSGPPPAPRPPGAAGIQNTAPETRKPAPRIVANPARPETPVAPTASTDTAEPRVIDDDDRVIVPAPSVEVFLHQAARGHKRAVETHGLALRRTFIPILLTGGVILAALAALHFAWPGETNPLGGLSTWLIVLLLVFALALWGLAALNMLSVKHQLERSAHPGDDS